MEWQNNKTHAQNELMKAVGLLNTHGELMKAGGLLNTHGELMNAGGFIKYAWRTDECWECIKLKTKDIPSPVGVGNSHCTASQYVHSLEDDIWYRASVVLS